MEKIITIKMMGEFSISVEGETTESLAGRSRKGVALMEYLILNWGKQIPKQRLLNMLWSDYLHMNPESALKTLISRIRKTLNDICDGLGGCIVSRRGSYSWETPPGLSVSVDLVDIMQIFEDLPREKDEQAKQLLFRRLIKLYTGDLFLTGDMEGGEGYRAALHNEYLNAVYDYIELLMQKEEYSRIVEVCRKARKIDEFDERLYLEMMQAQVEVNRLDDAMEEYRRVKNLNRKYLDAEPSDEMQDFYEKMVRIRSGNSLKFNLEAVRSHLQEDPRIQGAYTCDYEEFCRIYTLLHPTLERLGCNMFLGIIMLEAQDENGAGKEERSVREELVKSLLGILCENLRRGDVVMRYNGSMVMVLLPTVNYTTGNMIMERIRYLFFERYPDEKVSFHYRLGEMRDQ